MYFKKEKKKLSAKFTQLGCLLSHPNWWKLNLSLIPCPKMTTSPQQEGSYGGSPVGTAWPTAVPPWWALVLLWMSTSHVYQRWGWVFSATASRRRQEQHPCTPQLHPPVMVPCLQVSKRASQLTSKVARPKSCLTHWLEQEQHKWRGFFMNIPAQGLDIPKFLSNCETPVAMTEDHAVCLAH